MHNYTPEDGDALFALQYAPYIKECPLFVLVQHRKIQDPDSGQFTVKIYDSKKIAFEDSWVHERIILRPDSRESGFKEIVLHQDDAAELRVIGEFVAVVG